MNLADARSAVIAATARMNSAYNNVLFDEWILVQVTKERGTILSYEGPRSDSYDKRFKADIAPLQADMLGRKMGVGDFEFTQAGHGTYFDACIRLGSSAYLFCNNTEKTMIDIRKEPLWLSAQKPFIELATKFRSDPLE